MPTIATIYTVVTTISKWQVLQLKPYRVRIVSLDFPTNGQAKELPYTEMETPLEGRPENLTGSLPTQGRVTSAKIGNY